MTTHDLSRLTRKPDRGQGGIAALNQLLDDVLVGTLSTVLDGQPWSVPMLFARDGDRLLVHGSTGAGALRHLASGAPVAFCVFTMDGLVVAESAFESSANYRSAVIRGTARPLAGDEAWEALELLTDRLIPGRSTEVQAMTRKEVAATTVLELLIEDGGWLFKQRTGWPGEPAEPTDAWMGVVPLSTVAGQPVAAPWIDDDAAVPASVSAFTEARTLP